MKGAKRCTVGDRAQSATTTDEPQRAALFVRRRCSPFNVLAFLDIQIGLEILGIFRYCAIALLLPSATERLVELDQALIFVPSRLCQRQFGGKERPLPVENFEIRCDPTPVALERGIDGILQVLHRDLLFHSNLMIFLIPDQCVGSVAKRVLDRLLVGD